MARPPSDYDRPANQPPRAQRIAEILLVLVALLTIPYLVYSTRAEVKR